VLDILRRAEKARWVLLHPICPRHGALYELIKDKTEVQLLNDPMTKIERSVVVLPLILAKGLEFDTAIAIDSMPADLFGRRRAQYSLPAGTRALHNLYYVNNCPLPRHTRTAGSCWSLYKDNAADIIIT
jgi:DNA helicase IV